MRKPFGSHKGCTLFYNEVIISVEEVDMPRMEYICHVQNYDETIRLNGQFIDYLLNLQEQIKTMKERYNR